MGSTSGVRGYKYQGPAGTRDDYLGGESSFQFIYRNQCQNPKLVTFRQGKRVHEREIPVSLGNFVISAYDSRFIGVQRVPNGIRILDIETMLWLGGKDHTLPGDSLVSALVHDEEIVFLVRTYHRNGQHEPNKSHRLVYWPINQGKLESGPVGDKERNWRPDVDVRADKAFCMETIFSMGAIHVSQGKQEGILWELEADKGRLVPTQGHNQAITYVKSLEAGVACHAHSGMIFVNKYKPPTGPS